MTEGRRSGICFIGNTPELQAEFDQAVAEIKRKYEIVSAPYRWECKMTDDEFWEFAKEYRSNPLGWWVTCQHCKGTWTPEKMDGCQVCPHCLSKDD